MASTGLIASASTVADSIDDLGLLTENFAPYNFEKYGKIQGTGVDVLEEMLSKTGSSKTRKDMTLLPWTTAYRVIQRKKNTMLFVMARTKAREEMFKWVGPLIPTSTAIISRKDRENKINSIADFNHYKIGAVRDDVAHLLLLEQGVDPGSIYTTVSGTGGENIGKMLSADRVDLWAYSKVVAFWNLKELGYSLSDFESVYTLKNSFLYFALNKDTDDKIINQLQVALDEMRFSGRLQQIIRNYLPKL